MFEFIMLGIAIASLVYIYYFKNKELKPNEWLWLGEGKDPFRK